MFTEYSSDDGDASEQENSYDAAFKMNLADEVLHRHSTGAKLAIQHHIRRTTVNKWVSRIKIQHILYSKGGRPRHLDAESMEFIRNRLRLNPTMDGAELKDLINVEYRLTYERTHPMDSIMDEDDPVDRKMQPKTLRNYIILFRKEISATL